MDPIEASCVTVWPGSSPESDRHRNCIVVWLSGEHDASTATVLSAALEEAERVPDGDVVVDLSGIEFMGAAIIGVFVQSAGNLRARSRELRLRYPSQCALRIVELCSLQAMLEPGPEVTRATGPVGALGTWVAVPRSDPSDQPGHWIGPSEQPSSPPHVPATGLRHDCAKTINSHR